MCSRMQAVGKSSEKSIPRHVLQSMEPALKHWSRIAYLFCTLRHVASWRASVLRSPHFNDYGKPFANHTVDLRRVGRLTLVGNSMGFVSKRSTLSAVKCIQMLKIGRFRGEPTLLCLALWALHPLNEVLAHLCFLIASATLCQHTGYSMGLST